MLWVEPVSSLPALSLSGSFSVLPGAICLITKVEVLFCRISESEVDTEATTLSMVVLPAFSRESTTGNS